MILYISVVVPLKVIDVTVSRLITLLPGLTLQRYWNDVRTSSLLAFCLSEIWVWRIAQTSLLRCSRQTWNWWSIALPEKTSPTILARVEVYQLKRPARKEPVDIKEDGRRWGLACSDLAIQEDRLPILVLQSPPQSLENSRCRIEARDELPSQSIKNKTAVKKEYKGSTGNRLTVKERS